MLETLDMTIKIDKNQYKECMTRMRAELRDLQQTIRNARIPVVVLFEGWEASGKGDAIASLVYPLDPRGFKVNTTQPPNEEETYRPFLWRFYTKLPSRGDFAFFDRSWYRRILEDRLDGLISHQQAILAANEIREFEQQLTDDGVVLLKFWLHITKKEQQKRLEAIKSDRYENWRLKQADWKKQRKYKDYAQAAEEMFAYTSTANAPWTLVESTYRFYKRTKIFETVTSALRSALTVRGIPLTHAGTDTEMGSRMVDPNYEALRERAKHINLEPPPTILDRIDINKRLTREEYDKKLNPLQERLRELLLECYRQRVGAIVVYEGWDAAGKGGNIKRLTQELDPRGYEVTSIAAPDATEKAHHYLWRFWKHIPKAGHMTIFDRSWYGRVLVERVEGFAQESEWRRAYQEINQFEGHIASFKTVVVKFWLHYSPEEQLRRFEEREKTPHKLYKITMEDWRNREKWNDYRRAAAEMIERTSTTYAPWTIVEAEDKLWARIKTLSTLVSALEERLEK
jgi:AMP-polyphosphate phosphotransferase